MSKEQTAPSESFRLAAQRIIEILTPCLLEARWAATKIVDVVSPRFRAIYEVEGSPYGPADEEMWRWFQDHREEIVRWYAARS